MKENRSSSYLDGLLQADEYRRQKQLLEDKLSALIVPGVDAAREAGKLLEDLPGLWRALRVKVRSSGRINPCKSWGPWRARF